MNNNKIAWLTDIHLNFLKLAERVQFYNRVAETDASKILITGDIAEAKDVCEILDEFSQHVNIPIYFGLCRKKFPDEIVSFIFFVDYQRCSVSNGVILNVI